MDAESVCDLMYITVHRKKTVAFMDVNKTCSVAEFKRMLQGVTRVPAGDIKLFAHNRILMEDSRQLSHYGYTVEEAKAHSPMVAYLTAKKEYDSFEDIEPADLTSPPELPHVMRPGEGDQDGLVVPN